MNNIPCLPGPAATRLSTCLCVMALLLPAASLAADTGGATRDETRLEIPYAGGPLPQEMMSPPPGTVVMLKAVPDGTPAAPRNAVLDEHPNAAPASNELVLPYNGGPLPPEMINPPPDTVVKLRVGPEDK